MAPRSWATGAEESCTTCPMTGAVGRWSSHCSGSERGQRQCELDVVRFV
jgi:hypothetical protein